MSTVLYYILWFFCYILSLLPFRVLYILSDIVYYPLYYVARYRRKLVRRNMMLAFPEKTEKEIVGIEKKFYSFFCDYLFETLKLLSITPKNMRRRMKFDGFDQIEESFAQGRSCGLYLGHYCNWEWISSIPLHLSKDIVCGQIYHKLQSEASDRLFLKLRGRMGAVSIPMKSTLRKIIEFRRSNKQFIIGFISDQAPKWENIHYWTEFLHRETPVFTGTERIARQTDMVMYYVDVKRPRRGYYHATFRKMTESPKDMPEYGLTELYMRMLEESIVSEPQYWLWTHNRWKRTREDFDRLYEVAADGRVIRKTLSDTTKNK